MDRASSTDVRVLCVVHAVFRVAFISNDTVSSIKALEHHGLSTPLGTPAITQECSRASITSACTSHGWKIS